jgi:RES domain-containing protein
MLLWRLSGSQHAKAFDGGYGLLFNGRWNTVGHAVTYCATSPSLCILEKLVHIEDPALLPELVMVTYRVPDDLGIEAIELDDMSGQWRKQETWTQQRGDFWHESRSKPLLCVPSAIVPITNSPDLNILINHNHPASAQVEIMRLEVFLFDPRLF